MYSVSEISKKLNVSKVTIYNDLKRFKSEIKPYLKTVNRSKYLTEEGFELLLELRGFKSDTNSSNDTNGESELFKEVEIYKEQIKFLKLQLEISQKNLEREQELHEHSQVLLKQAQDKLLLSSPNSLSDQEEEFRENENTTKSLWSKLFK